MLADELENIIRENLRASASNFWRGYQNYFPAQISRLRRPEEHMLLSDHRRRRRESDLVDIDGGTAP